MILVRITIILEAIAGKVLKMPSRTGILAPQGRPVMNVAARLLGCTAIVLLYSMAN